MNKKVLLLLLLLLTISLISSGCVSYKYDIRPDGKQLQVGDYMQHPEIYMDSHFICTKTGKKIKELNKRVEEYLLKNK